MQYSLVESIFLHYECPLIMTDSFSIRNAFKRAQHFVLPYLDYLIKKKTTISSSVRPILNYIFISRYIGINIHWIKINLLSNNVQSKVAVAKHITE